MNAHVAVRGIVFLSLPLSMTIAFLSPSVCFGFLSPLCCTLYLFSLLSPSPPHPLPPSLSPSPPLSLLWLPLRGRVLLGIQQLQEDQGRAAATALRAGG